jgi:hypothetical protein
VCRSLRIHVSLVQQILDYTNKFAFQNRIDAELRAITGLEMPLSYLSDCMYRKEPVDLVLRMLCLKSVAEGGIKEKDLESICKEFLQVCGALPLQSCVIVRAASRCLTLGGLFCGAQSGSATATTTCSLCST